MPRHVDELGPNANPEGLAYKFAEFADKLESMLERDFEMRKVLYERISNIEKKLEDSNKRIGELERTERLHANHNAPCMAHAKIC